MPIIPRVAEYGFQHVALTYNAYTSQEETAPGGDWHNAHIFRRKLGSHASMILLSDEQKYTIQIVATVMASISITAAMIALYWFCLMRRNFRRDLILLLVLSDLFKNFCYILYSGVSLTQGQIQDASIFCQASGYLLQTGLEACDFAVFFISLHMTLQIFPLPNTILGYEGLYNVRYWVYAIWFFVPNITASLAFINDNGAYQIQGAWCWLPVRPFWYRLALAWIPRYVITILIMGAAITIYFYVGAEMKLFGRQMEISSGDGSSSATHRRSTLNRTDTGTTSMASMPTLTPTLERQPSILSNLERSESHPVGAGSIRDKRRSSLPAWHSPFEEPQYNSEHRGSQSATTSRRGSRQVTFDFAAPPDGALSPMQQPTTPIAPPMSPRLPVIPQEESNSQPASPPLRSRMFSQRSEGSSASDPMQSRRRAIKRQVKSLFVYPVAYLVFWIIPFVLHCMNYSDYYAAHPVFAISLLASFCTTTLGLVDVIIFSWRERPWLHISGSDGTLLGSFCFWRFKGDLPFVSRRRALASAGDVPDSDEKLSHSRSTSLLGMVKNSWRRLSSSASAYANTGECPSSRKRSGGGSTGGGGGPDSRVRAREFAQKRLALEREGHMAQARGDGQTSPAAAPQSAGHRNWFDDISEINIPIKSRRPTWSA